METSASPSWHEAAQAALDALSDAIQSAALDWSLALPARWPTMTAEKADGGLAVVASSGTDDELQAIEAWIADIERLDRVRELLVEAVSARA